MHKLTFYPLGNAETLLVDLDNGRKVLVDYANKREPDNRYDLRCDLPNLLKDDMKAADRDYYDAVAFTHLDDDHVHGASEFFWLQHAEKYQDKDRFKISEMWVPAAAIVEKRLDGDSLIIRAEARHRLRQGKGIRVFSAPTTLSQWFEEEGLDLADYCKRGIVLDAGKTVPTFTLANDDAEFFIHSPFASRTEDGSVHVRNIDAIVMQAVFQLGGTTTRALITADIPYEQFDEIVRVTKQHKHEERLKWDIMDVSHHCSYLAIGPEKGKTKTEPTENVKWLFEQGQSEGHLVSSSVIIPTQDTDQPPHVQAANYYRQVAADIDGEFNVTMEYPKKTAPAPLVIEIGSGGATLKRDAVVTVGGGITSQPAHRVG